MSNIQQLLLYLQLRKQDFFYIRIRYNRILQVATKNREIFRIELQCNLGCASRMARAMIPVVSSKVFPDTVVLRRRSLSHTFFYDHAAVL